MNIPGLVGLTIQQGRQETNETNNKTTVYVRSRWELRRKKQDKDGHGEWTEWKSLPRR